MKTCPVDATPLSQEAFGSELVHRCATCDGVLVDGHVLPEVRAYAALQLHRAKRTNPADCMRQIVCPDEAMPMMVLNYKGIEIDVCPCCCSVWLDVGEFEKIVHYVQKPRHRKLSEQGADGDVFDAVEDGIELADGVSDFELCDLSELIDFVSEAVSSVIDSIGS